MAQKVKFYTDEHVANAVVKGLRRRGVDVKSAVEAGMLGASDPDHLARATREERVVFTQDDDFIRLHAAGVQHAGIAFAPRKMSVGQIVRALVLIYDVLDADDMKNQVEYI